MSKPFQFSMRRMLCAVALFCAAASLVSFAFTDGASDHLAAAALTAAGTLGGAGVGLLFRRPTIGAIIGFLIIGLAVGILVVLTWNGASVIFVGSLESIAKWAI